MRNILHPKKLSSNSRLLAIIINGWGNNNHVYQHIYKHLHGKKITTGGGSATKQQKKPEGPHPVNSYENNGQMGGIRFGTSPNVYNGPPGWQLSQQLHGTQTKTNVPSCGTYTNTIKNFDNLFYCYTCGYSVNQIETQ